MQLNRFWKLFNLFLKCELKKFSKISKYCVNWTGIVWLFRFCFFFLLNVFRVSWTDTPLDTLRSARILLKLWKCDITVWEFSVSVKCCSYSCHTGSASHAIYFVRCVVECRTTPWHCPHKTHPSITDDVPYSLRLFVERRIRRKSDGTAQATGIFTQFFPLWPYEMSMHTTDCVVHTRKIPNDLSVLPSFCHIYIFIQIGERMSIVILLCARIE